MWNYEKRLQYPISISTPNAKMASFIISQYGGPDGEMGASMRYLAQRFSFANPRIAGVLTDIGTEELAHLEMIGAIVRQLTRGLSAKELEASGLHHIILITPQVSGHRLRVEFHFPLPNFSQAVMPLLIWWKIWQQNKKQENV